MGDQVPAAQLLAEFHTHLAGVGSPLVTFLPHSLQSPYAALVACAPRFDPLSDPDFFLSQLLVK